MKKFGSNTYRNGMTSLLVILGVFGTSLAHALTATGCAAPVLKDLTVYSVKDISANNSDFQGRVAVGGHLTVSSFLLNENSTAGRCPSTSVGGIFILQDGKSLGTIEAGGELHLRSARVVKDVYSSTAVYIDGASIGGRAFSPQRPRVADRFPTNPLWTKSNANLVTKFSNLAEELNNQSDAYAVLDSTFAKEMDSSQMTLTLGILPVEVITLSDAELESHENVVINGGIDQKLIVNVSGTNVELKDRYVYLSGGIDYKNIVWNFYEAETLIIQNTGEPVLGMPGTVMAPHASTQFYDGLITGKLYVYDLVYDANRFGIAKSGQVNSLAPVSGNKPNE